MRWSVFAVALAAMLTTSAYAVEVTLHDMQVVGRALAFTKNVKRQGATLIVVFDPSNPASVGQMETTLRSLGKGLKVGDRTLSAVAVDERQLGTARQGDAVFATAGVDQTVLAGFLRQNGMPCFTLETAQVRDGACMVAIRSHPTVAISINSRNASAAGVSFATAFLMMVREL